MSVRKNDLGNNGPLKYTLNFEKFGAAQVILRCYIVCKYQQKVSQ